MIWLACVLFALSLGGLAYAIAQSFVEGAQNYNSTYEDAIDKSLQDIFLFIPAKKLVELSWALAAVAFLLFAAPLFNPSTPGMLLLGLGLGTAAGGGAFHLPNYVIKYLTQKRRNTFNLQLVEALATMANALRAGFSINQAIEAIVETGNNPIAQEFQVFLQQLRVGVGFSDALQSLATRVASEDLELVVTAIDIARKTGGNLTEIFDTIAETIRGRQRIELRIRTLTAQGRLQGIMLSAMPFLLGLGMLLMKPGMMKPFLFSTVGVCVIGVIVILVVLGGLMIKKIVTIDI